MMQSNFSDDQVVYMTVMDDVGQPYTCDQWGNNGAIGYPYIIDDGQGYYMYELFYPIISIPEYPKNILIDHNFEVKYKMEGHSEELLKLYVQDLVNNL